MRCGVRWMRCTVKSKQWQVRAGTKKRINTENTEAQRSQRRDRKKGPRQVRLLRNKDEREIEAMLRVPERRFFVFWGKFTRLLRDYRRKRIQVPCRAVFSWRPPRIFSMRFRL
jgi:hypothetical protein